jgi:hypothetical protein
MVFCLLVTCQQTPDGPECLEGCKAIAEQCVATGTNQTP